MVGSVSYAERAGFDPLACYDHGEQFTWGDRSPTYCRRRVRFPGSLPRVPLAQWQVLSPDERPTKVRFLHGTRRCCGATRRSRLISDRLVVRVHPASRHHGVRSVVASTRARDSRSEGSIPPYTRSWSRSSLVRARGCRPRQASSILVGTAVFDLFHSGGACAKGASCTCNAAAAGSIPVLSTERGQASCV